MVSKSLQEEKDEYDAGGLSKQEPKLKYQSVIEKFRSSELFVTIVFGLLVAMAYAGNLVSPLVWGGSLLYIPGLIAGFLSSVAYIGNYSSEKIASVTGLISSLPLLVAVIELHMYYGVNADVFISVIASMSTAVILGLVGHYIYHIIQNHGIKRS